LARIPHFNERTNSDKHDDARSVTDIENAIYAKLDEQSLLRSLFALKQFNDVLNIDFNPNMLKKTAVISFWAVLRFLGQIENNVKPCGSQMRLAAVMANSGGGQAQSYMRICSLLRGRTP
jgi:hypothetical protein